MPKPTNETVQNISQRLAELEEIERIINNPLFKKHKVISEAKRFHIQFKLAYCRAFLKYKGKKSARAVVLELSQKKEFCSLSPFSLYTIIIGYNRYDKIKGR